MKKRFNFSNGGCAIFLIVFVLGSALSFLVTAGLTRFLFMALSAIGVTLPFDWSWWIPAIVWTVLLLLGSIFKSAN